MAQLTIEKDGEKVELLIDGEKRVKFSVDVEMGIGEVVEQITKALQGLPKDLEMTRESILELVNILIPDLKGRVQIIDDEKGLSEKKEFISVFAWYVGDIWGDFSQKLVTEYVTFLEEVEKGFIDVVADFIEILQAEGGIKLLNSEMQEKGFSRVEIEKFIEVLQKREIQERLRDILDNLNI